MTGAVTLIFTSSEKNRRLCELNANPFTLIAGSDVNATSSIPKASSVIISYIGKFITHNVFLISDVPFFFVLLLKSNIYGRNKRTTLSDKG